MSKSLNRVIVEEYLKDLRSGNFKQCRSLLHILDAHCAIGLFEITYERITGKHLSEAEAYSKFIDITEIDTRPIWERNDSGATFSEIADYIEENSPVMEKEHV